jgi:hypothetical protein
MSLESREPRRMTSEGAEVVFRGEGFPPNAAAELSKILNSLERRQPTKVKIAKQPLEKIPEPEIASAFELVKADMLDDEAEFENLARTAQPAVNPEDPRVRQAVEGLHDMSDNAYDAGIFIKFEVSEDPGFLPPTV